MITEIRKESLCRELLNAVTIKMLTTKLLQIFEVVLRLLKRFVHFDCHSVEDRVPDSSLLTKAPSGTRTKARVSKS